jgi:hypothetical protein
MKNHKMIPAVLRVAFVLLASAAFAAGCAKKQAQEPAATEQAQAQTAFATPEEAAAAFVGAVEKNDSAALHAMLGVGADELMSSGDAVADKSDQEWLVSTYNSKHSLEADGADKMILAVGEDAWPLPIPIVKRDGKWYLDGASGVDEVIYRRVGRNELGAIDVCRGFVSAQNEYASQGHDGDPAGIYALKLISDKGMQNGLYWPTAEGEPASPAGPFVASAAAEGYHAADGESRKPYHGYYYRMLFKQGASANGGAKEYFKDGVLTEGFALVAWPADYGSSGVQTFIVNQDGVVFQKDLGEDTAKAVEAIQSFDPDSSWTAIAPPAADGATAPAN